MKSSTPEPPRWHLALASGQPQWRLDTGSATDLASLDALLLAWLALEGPSARDRVATLLWPQSDEAAARNALRQRLFRLRRQLGDVVQGSSQLSLHAACVHDLQGASGLLGQLPCPVPGELAHWLEQRRQALGGAQARRLAERIHALEAAGQWAEALALAQQALPTEHLSEAAHRRVMRLHYLCGDSASALLAFDTCEQMLKHEVGARPSVQTLELLHTIEQGQELAPPPGSGPTTTRPPPPLPAAVLRPPRLVGREAALHQVTQALQSAQTVLLLGEAGMGKSRLLQALQMAWPGMRVVQGRPGDHLAPYATLARALREALRGLKLSAEQGAALAAILPEYTPDGTPETASDTASETAPQTPPAPADATAQHGAARPGKLLAAVHTALGLALAQGGARALRVLALDDLHFADAATLELLQALLAAPRAQPASAATTAGVDNAATAAPTLCWCLGLRPPEEDSPQAELLRAIAAAAPCTRLLLQALDVAQLERFVHSLGLPGVDAAALAPALHARTGGNPLYALETLKLAWNEGLIGQGAAAAPPALPRPATLAQLVGQQLARLSPAALMLARVAAVAGVDFELDLAAAVLEQHPLALADAWGQLQAQQVLRDAQFVHDLIHDAVLQAVPAIIARHLHARVAQHLQSHGGEPARVAAHWEAAGQPQQALPALKAAAQKAQAALRGAESIALQLRAAELAQAQGDAGAAFDAVRSALQTHMHTLRESAGWPLLERLQALAQTPLQQAQALAERAWYGTVLGQWESAARDGQAALALALPTGNETLIHSVRQRLGTVLALLGRFDEALPQMQAAQPWIDAHASETERAEFHGNLATVLDNLGQPLQARAAHERALSHTHGVGEQAHRASQLANHALSRLEAGSAHEALALAKAAQQIISAFELDSASAGFVAVLMAQALRVLGRLGPALECCERAHDILQRRNASRVPVLLLQRGHVWLDAGQFARAAQDFAAAGQGQLAPRYEVRRLVLLARLAAWQGGDAAAPLAAARQALPNSGWPELRWMVESEAAALGLLPAGPALSQLKEMAASAQACGLLGSALVAQARWLQCAAGAGGDVDARGAAGAAKHTAANKKAAQAAAQAALALAQAQPPVASPWMSTPHWAWALRQGLLAAGWPASHALVHAAQASAAAWLGEAQASLPQALQHGLWQLHPVHRAWQPLLHKAP